MEDGEADGSYQKRGRMKYVFLLCLCVTAGVARRLAQFSHLKTTFGLNPFSSKYFTSQPLNRDDAISEGLQPLDTTKNCNSGKFLGHAYADPEEPSLVLLFDEAGNLAGSQSVLLKSALVGSSVPFGSASMPAYQEGSFFGAEAYFTTAYFMDPELICNGGRREDDLGDAGDRLLIQVGPTPDNFVDVPIQRDEADDRLSDWNPHYCFLGMGMHYMTFNYEADQKCEEVFPAQLLYSKGELIGFVWQHLAMLPGDRWEHPSDGAASKIIKLRPSCVKSLAENPGLSTLHHYFYKRPYFTLCPPSEMASLFSDDRS